MAQSLSAAMPRDYDLDGGYVLRITAVDPTTGAAVSGVTVSNIVLMAVNVAGVEPGDLALGDWVLVPGPE